MKKYVKNIIDLKEQKTITYSLENKKEEYKLIITFDHKPNIVGPRSEYNGLPIWIGKTIATAKFDGKTIKKEAFCWLNEPFQYEQARVVCAGRILKAAKLPTALSEQVKDKPLH